MVKLYFRYGAMGSSKTANALMVEYNYYERGKKALLVKPKLDSRDGDYTIRSRIGLAKEGILLEQLTEMSDEELRGYDCVIVDEAQFATKAQVEFMVHIVDGKAATCNARIGEDGHMVREGEQVMMGGNDRYISLCRRHHMLGDLGPGRKAAPADVLTGE